MADQIIMATPAPSPPPRAYSRLDSAIGQLADAVGLLQARLAPVLGPESAAGEYAYSESSPLARLVDRVEDIQRSVADILTRLDL